MANLSQKADTSALQSGLIHIAREVAQDHSVVVAIGKPGGGSFANLEERRLTLDPEHIKNPSEARFVAAHEGAHLRDTPSLQELGLNKGAIKELTKNIGIFALKNVIEDGAINDRFVRDFKALQNDTLASYPRASEILGCVNHPEVMQAVQRLGFVPRFGQALAALLGDWSEIRHTLGFGRSIEELSVVPYSGPPTKDAAINDFIRRTRVEARRAISMIYAPSADGKEMLTAGRNRHAWCVQVLYPELKKLVALDIQTFKQNAEQPSEQDEASSQAQNGSNDNGTKPKQGKDEKDSEQEATARPVSKGQKGELSGELERQAREAIAAFDDALREALKGIFDKWKDAPSTKSIIQKQNAEEREKEKAAIDCVAHETAHKQLTEALRNNLSPYQKYYVAVASAIDAAHSRLVDTFVPLSHFSWERNQKSGSKLDLVRAMRFEATGFGTDTLFMRRRDPTRPDIKIALIIDCSSSMEENERIDYARHAAVFAKELFFRLGIGCACISFSDDQKLLLDFEDDPSNADLQDQFIAQLEPEGGTKDGDALNFALNLLIEKVASSRAVIMISDAGTQQENIVRNAVASLQERHISLIHFGIGAGTSDKLKLYPLSFGNLPLQGANNFFEMFALQMEKLAEKLLLHT